MSTYWLCRTPGGETEGPFTLGQLQRMHAAGSVTAESQVCRHGEEEWLSLDDELAMCDMDRLAAAPAPAPAPPQVIVQPAKPRKGRLGCLLIVAGLLLAFTAFFYQWAEREHGNPQGELIDFRIDVESLIRSSIADPEASIVGIGMHTTVGGKVFRIVQIRARNLLGGPIIAEVLVEGKTPGDAHQMVMLKDFEKRWRDYKGLTPEQAQEVAKDLIITLE